jgi:hypothetical protein
LPSVLLLFTIVTAARSVSAQYAFHAYVDPHHGDDILASAANSQLLAPISKRPLASHPDMTFPDPTYNPDLPVGYLQHAPYSFKTVNGPNGVLNYLRARFYVGGASLPWANPDNGRQIARIIVHCLPGLYGPYRGATYDPLLDIDPASGHRFNGDPFPIELPDGVCIQGTRRSTRPSTRATTRSACSTSRRSRPRRRTRRRSSTASRSAAR